LQRVTGRLAFNDDDAPGVANLISPVQWQVSDAQTAQAVLAAAHPPHLFRAIIKVVSDVFDGFAIDGSNQPAARADILRPRSFGRRLTSAVPVARFVTVCVEWLSSVADATVTGTVQAMRVGAAVLLG
jgi:hypothetical protein